MTYQPPTRDDPLVETMTFGTLSRLNDGGSQRADFHVLALVDSGRASVTIDFVDYPLRARHSVWIPAGAVHRWSDIASLSGTLVLFIPTAPATPAARDIVRASVVGAVVAHTDDEWGLITAALRHLLVETGLPPLRRLDLMPPILLSALLIRLEPQPNTRVGGSELFSDFCEAVERHMRDHHDARYYADLLGYSSKTLTRAVQAAAGQTPKSFISDRLALEAKRLLAHDNLSAAECARVLGFADASNFSTFFRNVTGQPPVEWRQSV